MESFVRLVSKWFKREAKADKNNAFKLSSLHPSTAQNLTKTLFSQIEVLTHLVLLSQHNCMESEVTARNWFQAFKKVIVNTDTVFMQQMRLKA